MTDRPGLTWTFRDGTTMDNVIEWAKKFEDDSYRVVQRDTVGDWVLSTIWQGMPSVLGEPNNYETAVLDSNAHVVWMKRWHTEESALAGHALTLGMLREGWDPVGADDGD